MRPIFVVTATLALVVTGCGSATVANPSVSAAESRRPTVTVIRRPLPVLRVPHYRTSGTYFEVVGRGVDLSRVNVEIRAAMRNEQRRYASLARAQEALLPIAVMRHFPGTFQTAFNTTLASASAVVVSALVPLLELYPGGNDGAGWLAVTIRVPSGSPVGISSLFDRRMHGLEGLSLAVRRQLVRSNSCFRTSLRDPIAYDDYARALAPRPANYRYFALAPRGLAIGFWNGAVAGIPCGRIAVIVPYQTIQRYLTELGRTLVAGVRPAKQ